MQFYVNAGDGTSGRKAQTIRLVGEGGVLWTMSTATTREGFAGFRLVQPGGDWLTETTDPNEAAGTVAGLLYRHRDASLVVEAGPTVLLRGDEERTADVYPPGRHPRINVEG